LRLPLQVSFRHMEPSEALEARVRELAHHLDHLSSRIMRCHVTIEAPHRHQHQGKLYEVHIDLTVPGGEVVVSRKHHDQHSHEDPYVALRDAFRAAERQLENFEREHRRDVKHHEPWPSGRISLLSPAEDFGRIETSDGRSIYFHRNSLVDAEFDRLTTGADVRFLEEAGERGPQASSVKLVPHSAPRP
jgi:cold shock CspA family protein/ribosome-associated translation inhibitor RaiA